MLKFSNDLVSQLVKCLLISMVSINLLTAQEKKGVPHIEKIYLHTDRTTYTIGESLWYKVYSVYAYNHLLFSNSNVLYVELISPDSKIIASHKTLLEGGLGHGDFELTDAIGIKAGVYQLRAYTNYSRNFGTDFVFKKDIEIIDVFDKSNNIHNKPLLLTSSSTTSYDSQQAIKAQFFPEGGSLIADVESVVAFKAVDANGHPVDVKGKIFDTEGILVALFISSHDGMGKFQFKPQNGKQYNAKLILAGDVLIDVPFPKVNQTGYALSYKKIDNKNVITVRTNQETLAQQPNPSVTLVSATRGISYYEGTQSLTKTTQAFQLYGNDFPEGISQITLYDAGLHPQSERLIFIEKQHDLNIKVATNKNIYKPKEPVDISVTSKTNAGLGVSASFSLSCVDMNGANDTKEYGTNICAYYLMESDIRGKVHNPGYYFDSSNPKRLEYLDLLLLTQGWRDFLWKTMPKEHDSIQYNIENGFTIAGRVKQLLRNKPKVNSNITLALMNKNGLKISSALTDANGVYKFENLLFNGTTNVFLNSKNENGKNDGEIIVYQTDIKPLQVDFKKETSVLQAMAMDTIKNTIYKKYIMYGIAPENVLDEVEIIAKKKDNTQSLYGMPDFSYVAGEESQTFNDIYQMIQYKIPGVMVVNDTIRFMRFRGAAHIILDGFPLNDQSQLNFILPDNVEKIDAIKGNGAAIFGSEGANGVIAIYTKDPSANVQSKKVFHSTTRKMEGFYEARVFYAPNLESKDLELDSKLAVRNTLYWNPYVHPDDTGFAKVTYYNTDVQTNVKVSLEGITANGIPVVFKTSYSIEN